jgi:hypothetical protein
MASLRRLWAVPLLAGLVLAGGTGGTLFAWNNYRAEMQALSLQVSFLPLQGLMGLVTGLSGADGAIYDEDYEEPAAIHLDAVTECYDYSEPASSSYYCNGYLDSVTGHHEQAVNLTPLGGTGPYHLELEVYSSGNIEARVLDGQPAYLLRAFGDLSGSARGYVGVVPLSFTIVFEILDGGSAEVDYSLNLATVED